jgi:hypothetical protein
MVFRDIVHSCESCEDEGHPSEELMELIQSLSARMEKLEADRACCSYEGDVEDILVLETNVFGNPAYDEEVISNTDQEKPNFDEYLNEEEEEPEGKFISFPEPISEKPLPETSQPALNVHPPVLTRDIHPCVSSCGADQAVCYKFSGVFHSFYEPVSEYLEWHFLHILEPPNFISTSTFGEKMKDVTILLSRLHYLLLITDRVNELPVRKLLEWLWWKFAFT